MTTTAPVISRTSASSQCPERVPAYRVYAQLTSTSALQRGMLSYIAFKHRRRHRLEDNSVTCATPHCSSSTEAYQPRTNALKSVVDSTTAFVFLQPMSVAVCCLLDAWPLSASIQTSGVVAWYVLTTYLTYGRRRGTQSLVITAGEATMKPPGTLGVRPAPRDTGWSVKPGV